MPTLPDIPPQNVNNTTTAQLIKRVRDLVAEEVPDFYDDDDEILPLLNEARLDCFSELHVLPASWSGVAIPGEPWVESPLNLGAWEEFACDGTSLDPLDALEYAKLPAETGTPTSYCPMYLAADGTPTTILYPTPTGANVLTGTYSRIPEELSDSQGPTWHREWHFIVCYFAAAMCLEKDHLGDNGDRMMARYEYQKGRYRDWWNKQLPYRQRIIQQVPKGSM